MEGKEGRPLKGINHDSLLMSITSGAGAEAARAVCSKMEGLRMGGLIASGSYGRVYRGDYYGSTVSV